MPYPRRLSADSSRCPYNNTDPKTVVERLRPPNPMSTLQIYGSYAMTSEEQELLEQYLTHRNVLGDEGTHPSIDAWYQEVRYAQGPNAPSPWRKPRSCATRTSSTPPEYSTGCRKTPGHCPEPDPPPAAPGRTPEGLAPHLPGIHPAWKGQTRLAAKEAPRKVPSASECRFCPIGSSIVPRGWNPDGRGPSPCQSEGAKLYKITSSEKESHGANVVIITCRACGYIRGTLHPAGAGQDRQEVRPVREMMATSLTTHPVGQPPSDKIKKTIPHCKCTESLTR